MTVTVDVDVETWTTAEVDPDDSWSRESTDGYVSGVRVYSSDKPADPVSYRAETFAVDVKKGDTVYVVVADYSSGDTFGTDGGYYQVVDVLTDEEEAEELSKAASAVSGLSLEFKGREYYVGWTGYFEFLNNIHVFAEIVR